MVLGSKIEELLLMSNVVEWCLAGDRGGSVVGWVVGVILSRHLLSRHSVLGQSAFKLVAFNKVASEGVVVGLEETSEVIPEEEVSEVMIVVGSGIAVGSAVVAVSDIKTVVALEVEEASHHRVRLVAPAEEAEVGMGVVVAAASTIDGTGMEAIEVQVVPEVGMGEATVASLEAIENLSLPEIEGTKSAIGNPVEDVTTPVADVTTITARESDSTRTTMTTRDRDDATDLGERSLHSTTPCIIKSKVCGWVQHTCQLTALCISTEIHVVCIRVRIHSESYLASQLKSRIFLIITCYHTELRSP